MRTLLVIDVQNDFMPGGSLAVEDGNLIVPIINKVLRDYDIIIATQDWHPEDHLSFAVNHKDKEVFDEIDLNGLNQTLWPVHCVQGSKGAEFHPDLNMKPIEAIFRKGMEAGIDSYSGFYDNGHKKSTGLAGYLREKGITEVDCCGLAADFCVYFTMKDALGEGFNVRLLTDATRPINADNYSKQIKELADNENFTSI